MAHERAGEGAWRGSLWEGRRRTEGVCGCGGRWLRGKRGGGAGQEQERAEWRRAGWRRMPARHLRGGARVCAGAGRATHCGQATFAKSREGTECRAGEWCGRGRATTAVRSVCERETASEIDARGEMCGSGEGYCVETRRRACAAPRYAAPAACRYGDVRGVLEV